MPDRNTPGPAPALAVRARRYAALGEPVRLQIIDHLSYGDASPGELGGVTGLATNLLAFHLSTLEEAGLIRRVRSEGDGRRSYVQLRWDDETVAAVVGAATNPLAGQPVPRVVFVCTHNSARSQLAAASWATMSRVPVASAGTHPAEQVHPKALDVARRHGLRVVRPGTHQVEQTLRPGDLVVAVCDNAHEELTATPPDLTLTTPTGAVGRGWLHWAIPDPVAEGSDAAFETAYADISHRVARLARALATA